MECESSLSATRRTSAFSQRGASIVEAVIALPILLVIILGAVQFGLVYEAKATLNHASLQAARLGAVRNADPDAIRRGLARGLAPIHAPDSSLQAVARTIMRIEADLPSDARIRILNPTREAFDDFGVDVDGEREIPNDRLHTRSTTVGAQSGINIQDANLLKVQITYGYELQVPLVNWFIARVLLGVTGGADAFEQQLLRRTRLPIIATATVRMQSPARLSDAVVSTGDFPNLDRIPSDAAPPAVEEEEEDGEEQPGDNESPPSGSGDEEDDDEGSDLGEGFMGFGGGEPGSGSGGAENGGGTGGGVNGGNPQQCSADDGGGGPAPFPFDEPPPGDSSPVPRPPGLPDWFDVSSGGSGASLSNVSLASLSVGNPIHVATGNKYQHETDIPDLPGLLGIGFHRHYNSSAVHERSVIGAGWRHSFQATLRKSSDDSIAIVQADGRLLWFERSEQAQRYIGVRASDGAVRGDEAGYRWTWTSGRELLFDSSGTLTHIRERGQQLRLRYNDSGDLVAITDPQERSLRMEYYPNGRIAVVRGPGMIGVSYSYDDAGNLTQAVASDGGARRYTYEDARHPHHLSTISAGTVRPLSYGARKPFERIATWAYDEEGRAVYSSHPNDTGKVTLHFAADRTEVTDAFGRTSIYLIGWRDGSAFVREVRGPGCGTCGQGDATYEYDDRLQPTKVAQKNGPALHYGYDTAGRLSEISKDVDGKREWLARYRYEGTSFRPFAIERPSVNPASIAKLELQYRPDGALELIRESGYVPKGASYSPIARETRLNYDERGRLSRIDGPRADVRDWTDFEYDERDRLIVVRSAAGERRVTAHDRSGRPTRITQTRRPDLKLSYDIKGRITSVTQLRSSGPLEVSYEYDHAGRLSQVVDGFGRRVRYGFDAAGRPNRMTSSASGLTAVARYAADDSIERIAAIGAKGEVFRTLYYAYDAERRLTEIRDGDGQPLQQLVYDNGDKLPDRRIDPLGHETSFGYDALGQIATILAPDGGHTRLERDQRGRIENFIAPNDARTTYTYDDFGRRVVEQSADRSETRYVYDASGNLIEKVDARGVKTKLEYDAANRLVSVEHVGGRATLRYENGLLKHVETSDADEHYEYDRDGQLIAHRRIIGDNDFVTRFTYDSLGQIETRKLPSGATLRYSYGPDGYLHEIVQERWRGDRVIIQAKQPSTGRAASLRPLGTFSSGNGVETKTTFDARSTNFSRRAIEHVASFKYEHDETGRITAIERDGVEQQYEYDAVGRLTKATSLHGELEYEYDANGNRIASADGSNMPQRMAGGEGRDSTRYSYATGSNRLVDVNAKVRYEYDAAGNPLVIGTQRFEYDANGRVIKLFERDVLLAEYKYNFWGERVQKIVHANGKRLVTSYIYEQQKLIAEADEDGDITREYVYLDHHPIALIERGVTFAIHTDHLGTPIAVTNRHKAVVWRADYSPFGEATIDHDPDGDRNPFTLNIRFPGQYADAEAGTNYNYFRTYDPKTGRYLTADPIGLAGGANLFEYAGNSPLDALDLLGLYQEDVHYYMTLFLAITAGIDPQMARQIALAAAFVDVNEATRPTDPENWWTIGASGFSNQPQLALYHFVLANPVDGETLPQYRNGNYHQVATQLSPQLSKMYEYATSALHYAPGSNPNCSDDPAQVQFFGEFLHSFADTYSHRNRADLPYDATALRYGIGHGLDYHWPDHTFNEDSWITREARTYAMELDVRDKLRQSEWADLSRSTTANQFDLLSEILRDFNRTVESEQHFASGANPGELWLRSEKIARLNLGLRELGYGSIDLTSPEFRFDEVEARRQRSDAFRGLDPTWYTQAILETR